MQKATLVKQYVIDTKNIKKSFANYAKYNKKKDD